MIVATREKKPVVRDDKQWTESFSMIRDLVTGKSFALDFVATAFLCDRAGRFWAGADRGEWGGLITRIDLNRGRVAVSIHRRPEKPVRRGPCGQGFTASSSCATARSGRMAERRTLASTKGRLLVLMREKRERWLRLSLPRKSTRSPIQAGPACQ